jgi:hypothetical protein
MNAHQAKRQPHRARPATGEETRAARAESLSFAFGGSFSDPPAQAEMQAFADYVESLRAALTRCSFAAISTAVTVEASGT